MNRRTARRIVLLRWLLLQGLVARMAGRNLKADLLHEEFLRECNLLPFWMHLDSGLLRHVEEPAARILHREGLLAQQGTKRPEVR